MIRAVVKNGVFEPIDPLPAGWSEGHAVVVEELDENIDTLEKWASDMNALTAELDDPAEWQRIEAALAESDREAKALVRREMGLH
jgi:hypothetical protein